MSTLATIAIINGHALIRDGLVYACGSHPSATVVHVGDDLDSLVEVDPSPTVVLIDLDHCEPAVTQTDVTAVVQRGCRVLAVGMFGQADVVRTMARAGVAGFVSTRDSTSTLHEAIDVVAAGGTWTTPTLAEALFYEPQRPHLSEQERRVLVLYVSGLKIPTVARQLGVKPSTVREYIERVRDKYAAVGRRAPTKLDLYNNAREDGLLDN